MATLTPSVRTRQPRYLLVANALIDDFAAGRFAVGDLIPTEAELGQQFNVSRHTVREAIRRLAEMGLVSAQAGVGTHVRSLRPISNYAQQAEGISDLFQYVRDVGLKIVRHDDFVADEALAKTLGCRVGQRWHHMRGIRHMAGDGQPIAVTDIYVVAGYRSAVAEVTEPSEPIYALIEAAYGLKTVEVRQEISAVLIEGDAAEVLRTPAGSPGLCVVRQYRSDGDELFEVAFNIHLGSQFSHVSTLRLQPGQGGSAG